jgi:tetratricopeptide (TPR) repeat protein
VKDLSLPEHYLDVGQPRRALELLDSADSGALEEPEFWRLRTHAHLDLEQYDKAVDAASEGLQRDPHDEWLLYLTALAQAERDRLAEAERSIIAALELTPDNPHMLAAYARITARGGQLDKANRLLDEAARVDPENADVVSTRAFIAYLQGRDRRAGKLTEEALALDPEHSGAHRIRGAAFLERGDMTEGRRALETAIRDDPTDRHLAEAVREARAWRHPLLWPMYPLQRLGVAGSWVAAVVTIFGLRSAGYGTAAGIAGAVWLFLVIYSWTIAPAAERWLVRRQQL